MRDILPTFNHWQKMTADPAISSVQPPASAAVGARARIRVFPLLLTAGFFVVLLAGVMQHEIWRDEAQSWLIARDHDTLAGVIDHLSSEAHPAMWYTCLWVISRFTRNVLAMQLFHALLATAAAALIAYRSPFKNWQKLLIVFGYFPLFEYGVISRAYGLGMLIVFATCALVPQGHRRPLVLALLLLVMANVSIYFWMIAAGIGIALLVENWMTRHDPGKRIASGLKVAAIAIWIAGLALSYWQLSRYAATTPTQTHTPMESKQMRDEPLARLRPLSRMIVPTPMYAWTTFFWETSIFDNIPTPLRAGIFLLIAVSLAAGLVYLLRKPALFALAAVGGGGQIVFGYLYYAGYLRHGGHLWVLILAILWLWPYFTYARPRWIGSGLLQTLPARFPFARRLGAAAFTLVLLIHAEAGVMAWINDIKRPFSGSRLIANYIRTEAPADAVLIGSRDIQSCTIAALLDRPIYYLESHRFGGPIEWELRQKIATPQTPAEAIDHLLDPGEQGLLISTRERRTDEKVVYQEVLRSPPTMVLDERLILYRVHLAPDSSL